MNPDSHLETREQAVEFLVHSSRINAEGLVRGRHITHLQILCPPTGRVGEIGRRRLRPKL